jgi:hypothetical protein
MSSSLPSSACRDTSGRPVAQVNTSSPVGSMCGVWFIAWRNLDSCS